MIDTYTWADNCYDYPLEQTVLYVCNDCRIKWRDKPKGDICPCCLKSYGNYIISTKTILKA